MDNPLRNSFFSPKFYTWGHGIEPFFNCQKNPFRIHLQLAENNTKALNFPLNESHSIDTYARTPYAIMGNKELIWTFQIKSSILHIYN